MTAHCFDSWSTPKLGQMTRIARQCVAEAQAAFAASGAEDRRRERTLMSYTTEVAELHCRRAEDRLAELQAELQRRVIECFRERRTPPRLGPEFRKDLWNRVPAEGAEVRA